MTRVVDFDEFSAEIAQRRLELGITDADDEACRNSGQRRTMRKRRQLAATRDRCLDAGIEVNLADFEEPPLLTAKNAWVRTTGAEVLCFALNDEHARCVFGLVVPAKSGIDRSVWVSQDYRFPFLVVAGVPGTTERPDAEATTLPLEASCATGAGRWLTANLEALVRLQQEDAALCIFRTLMVKLGSGQTAAERAAEARVPRWLW
ncbi:MAG: hypothetical protein ACRYHQ_36535 [Janthinobacterium lividum]